MFLIKKQSYSIIRAVMSNFLDNIEILLYIPLKIIDKKELNSKRINFTILLNDLY